jgi:hypothetical protein
VMESAVAANDCLSRSNAVSWSGRAGMGPAPRQQQCGCC